MSLPVVLIHGYSDEGASFGLWRRALAAAGHDVTAVHTCEYETLTNEVSIRDLAEGFDRALREQVGLSADEPFDAIVHSTGMLVIRSWLAAYAKRRSRLKHLVGLAPASFGSPLAHKGRSWLGSIFKGRKAFGPDFLEAGDRILDGLELASRFTWDLAHRDLVGEAARRDPTFGPTGATPYVFTFCGDKSYGGLKRLISEPGTDGTVRWAGCSLDSRKITVDLTVEPGVDPGRRFRIEPWAPGPWSLIPVLDHNHGTILREPAPALVKMVTSALEVSSKAAYERWQQSPAVMAAVQRHGTMRRYQQFVVRAVDERGDPIPDYNLQLFTHGENGRPKPLRDFSMDVHVYGGDSSLRTFHVDLSKMKPEKLENLWLRVIASSGSRLVGYHGFGSEKVDPRQRRVHEEGKWDAAVNVTPMLRDTAVKFFYPSTTTLIELRLNREPLPLAGRPDVFRIFNAEG